MANVSGVGTTWNVLNYFGLLLTSDLIDTPFTRMAGGLNGGQQTNNFEFPTDVQYDHETAAQPAITETASLTAPTAISYTRSQSKNVCQIFQEQIYLSYEKMANGDRLSGICTAGEQNNVNNEFNWQTQKAFEKVARDFEYTCLNGTYQIATAANVANKTRGMLAACTTNATAAAGATLSRELLEGLLQTMHSNGSMFANPVIWVNGFQKRQLSGIYGYAPESRNVGGVNIMQIETDFGIMGVADAHRFMPTDSLLVSDMSVVNIVSQPVPNKGNLFVEMLAKTGAGENGQIFGKLGLNHGPEFMHGKITGLATS